MNQQSSTAQQSISHSDLKQWAQQDAQNDNAKGNNCHQSFEGRIQLIMQHYTADITKNFIGEFQSRIKDIQDDFSKIVGRLVDNPAPYIKEIETQVNAAIATAEKQFAPKIKNLQMELAEWEARFKSGLHNGISNPKNQNPVWHWGLILFLFAIEVILNSRFFAETSEYGLLGGTMAAITVSVVNVGVPILLGFFAHKLYYSKGALPNAAGIVVILLLVIVASVFNYQVAEFRDHMLGAAGHPPSPFPEYFALLTIGGAIAIISFWKMFSYMDPYDRPRRCHENNERAINDYENTALKPIREAQNAVNEILKEIQIQLNKTQGVIEREIADFDYRCTEAIKDSNKSVDTYHHIYCPVKADPDPPKPDFSEEDFDFSSAQKFVSKIIGNLEDSCRKAKENWLPLHQKVRQDLVDTHQKFQAVVVANIQAAISQAS